MSRRSLFFYMQTRRSSLAEVLTGTAVGLVLAWVCGQYWIYPAFGYHPDLETNLEMTLWFTVVGIVRSYVWRRLFNWLSVR